MALEIPAVVAVTGSAKPVCTIPPGSCSVVLSCTGSETAYIGTGSGVTTSNGFPLPAGQTVTFQGYTGSAGSQLYVIGASTGSNLGVIISTAQ